MKKLLQDIVLFKISGIAAGWLLTMAATLRQEPGDCALLMAASALLGVLTVSFPDPKLRWLPRFTPLILLLPFRPPFLLCAAAAFSGGMFRLPAHRQILYFSGVGTGVLLALCAGDLLYRPLATATAIAAAMPALFALTIYKLPLKRSGKILFPLFFFLAAAANLLVFLVRENHPQTPFRAANAYGGWQIRFGENGNFHYTVGNWICRMPEDLMRHRETVLPAALQCSRENNQVLFVAAAPSATAKYFQEMPWVDQVFLLLEGFPARLLGKEIRESFYHGFAELEKIPRDLQLIYLSELPPMSSAASRKLLQKLRDFAPDAPIVLPRSLAGELDGTHPLPGCPGMMVWGGADPALTFEALEKRLALYDPDQVILPSGMLETLYSLADPPQELLPQPHSLLFRWENFLQTTFPALRHSIFPMILVSGLLLLRFWLERYPAAGAQNICTLNAAAFMAALLLLVEGLTAQPMLLWGRSPMPVLAMALALPPGAPGRGKCGILLIPALAAAYAGLYFSEPLALGGFFFLLFGASFCPMREDRFRSRYLHALGLLCGAVCYRLLPPGGEGLLYAGVLLLPNLWNHSDSSSSPKR